MSCCSHHRHHHHHYYCYEDSFFQEQLDFCDPWFDDFDVSDSVFCATPDNVRWITKPKKFTSTSTSVPTTTNTSDDDDDDDDVSLATISRATDAEKFCVELNVAGFNPESIKTKVDGRKVIVEGNEEDRDESGDFTIRQIRKTYDLPESADITQLRSYVTPENMLTIEVPIVNPEPERRTEETDDDNESLAQFGESLDPSFDYAGFLSGPGFQPRIVDIGDNQKELQFEMEMKNYRPEDIKVTVRNNDVIIKAQYKYKNDKSTERSTFFKSITVPPGTQIEQLKTDLLEDGQLKITAPFIQQN
ncbi:unnamed protein product [Adineta steineri]|uniref:SHSP domain-containing protein n=1 Tax=Adineta steineri TaxID=433720 RepID=A0A815AE91_9BILA|nr:unnamed protein product [Adineta steineri]CAF1256185.1 unnamed protein product [Adineta steineri]